MACPHGLKVATGGEIGKTLAKFVELSLIGGIAYAVLVAIDIVANHQEKVRVFGGDALQCIGRSGFFLIMTRANQHARQDRVFRRQRQSGGRGRIKLFRQCAVIGVERVFGILRRARYARNGDRPRRLTRREPCNDNRTDNTFHSTPPRYLYLQ